MRSLPLLVTYKTKPSVVRAMATELGIKGDEVNRAVELVSQGFPPLTRRQWLPFLFGVSPKLLGAMGTRPDRYYRRFRLRKRAGGYREVVTPRRFLKAVQRWILHHILARLPRAVSVHGFVQGRGIFSNAVVHLAGRNLLAVDIRDFFPRVSRNRVVEVLVEHVPYSGPVASQLAGLCTLDGSLPQGAPTSPALANAVFHPIDLTLEAIARGWGCAYTRYADDLAFSGQRSFGAQDVQAISNAVAEGGFRLHPEKTRIVGSGGRQVVAGLVVNKSGLPPRESRRRWRAMFHRADRFPHEFTDRAHQLLGVASFVNQYDPQVAKRYFDVGRRVLALDREGGSK